MYALVKKYCVAFALAAFASTCHAAPAKSAPASFDNTRCELLEKTETLDRNKCAVVEGDGFSIDKSNSSSVYEGNVVLSQGTMRLTAEKIVVKNDADGYTFAQLFGSSKAQIKFRQKRFAANDYVEGLSDRAEFDDRNDTVKLLGNARIQTSGEDVRSEYIYYNAADETVQARGAIPGGASNKSATTPTGRVRMIIQPKIDSDKPKAPSPK